jgi:hypothetical protein
MVAQFSGAQYDARGVGRAREPTGLTSVLKEKKTGSRGLLRRKPGRGRGYGVGQNEAKLAHDAGNAFSLFSFGICVLILGFRIQS